MIVVGGGGSGLAAAVAAAENGARVLLLEKTAHLGGTTGIAVGSFTANRTSTSAAPGSTTTPTTTRPTPAISARRGPSAEQQPVAAVLPGTRRRNAGLADGHGPAVLRAQPRAAQPRAADAQRGAQRQGLHRHAAEPAAAAGRHGSSATVRSSSCMCGRTGDGVVARLQRPQHARFVPRRGVVLAAGDYANSPELIGQYKGPAVHRRSKGSIRTPRRRPSAGRAGGRGPVNMAITYGPELRFVPPPRKPFTQLLPGSGPVARLMGRLLPLVPRGMITPMVKRLLVTWQHPEDTLFDEGAVLVNRQAASGSATNGRPGPRDRHRPSAGQAGLHLCWTGD